MLCDRRSMRQCVCQANSDPDGLARTKDVLVKVGDKVREMTLPEFLEAVGFPNVTVGED